MKSAEEFIQQQQMIDAGDTVLVAVSGGRDSMALLHFLLTQNIAVEIAHVNYGLRGEDSNKDEKLIRDFALLHGIPFHVQHIEAETFEGQNIQLKAREIRYAFFRDILAHGTCTKVATAHHLDDQIETLFLNLLRGTGIYGAGGIPPMEHRIIRPFLASSRSEIDTYIGEHQVPFRDDATNESDKYQRNRIRHHLIPLLNELDEHTNEKLRSTIGHLRQDGLALRALIDAIAEKAGDRIEIDLANFPEVSRDTIVYHALRDLGFNRTQAGDLVGSEAGEIRSATHRAIKQGTRVVATPIESRKTDHILKEEGDYSIDQTKLRIQRKKFEFSELPRHGKTVWLDSSKITFPLKWRTALPSDRFHPLGSNYQVQLMDYLRDQGMNRLDRERQMVLASKEEEVLWIAGRQISERVKCADATTEVISIELSYI